MARRLVEAGVEIVTTELDGPLCGRVANWDDHAVNHHVFDALKYRAPFFDQAVTALIEDIYARGLDERVLVVVTGEFGRTPKISLRGQQRRRRGQRGGRHGPAGPRPLAAGQLDALGRRRHRHRPGHRGDRPARRGRGRPPRRPAGLPGDDLPPPGHRLREGHAPRLHRPADAHRQRRPADRASCSPCPERPRLRGGPRKRVAGPRPATPWPRPCPAHRTSPASSHTLRMRSAHRGRSDGGPGPDQATVSAPWTSTA